MADAKGQEQMTEELDRRLDILKTEYRKKFGREHRQLNVSTPEMVRLIEESLRTGKTIIEVFRGEFERRVVSLMKEYQKRFGEPAVGWDISGTGEHIRLIEEALRTGKTIWEIQTENLPPDAVL